ncbi:MAG: 4-alpha-glucanotransferase [Acidobacteriota bacterium]
MKTRKSGVLLHVTSLPSPYGIGDFGKGAYGFADFLSSSGQSVWQMLPLNPSSGACGNSPYCSYSAFAGNTVLISPDILVEEGLLSPEDLEQGRPDFSASRVDYDMVSGYKSALVRKAFERFQSRPRGEFDYFCRGNGYWLDDYALFASLKERFGGVSWIEWPREIRYREEEALARWRSELEERMLLEKFSQYLFHRQWTALKTYCNGKSIQMFGDMPIYVSYDSADVWANPANFKLDGERKPWVVAGVPPDYFSETGQLWGNPVYNWDALRDTRFGWWVSRMERNLDLFDLVRLDHFRGFVSFWEVPATEVTAINGKWVDVPVWDFFHTLSKRFPYLPIIAEDLGTITPDVRELMTAFGFPGMKLLHFAFGWDMPANPYIPHNHTENSVVYTGTHDNNTTRGWFVHDLSDDDRQRLFKYVGRSFSEDESAWVLIRLAMGSVSSLAVIPMQDILGLGEEARMNTPSIANGNWAWRLFDEQLTPEVAERLLDMTRLCGRA